MEKLPNSGIKTQSNFKRKSTPDTAILTTNRLPERTIKERYQTELGLDQALTERKGLMVRCVRAACFIVSKHGLVATGSWG